MTSPPTRAGASGPPSHARLRGAGYNGAMRTSALERFLRYVRIDTRSDERSLTSPSTPGQLVLLNLLVSELHAVGVADARVDEYGVLMATVPSTTSRPGIPTIGFIAHVDTSPEMSGADVTPIVHPRYDGRDLVLPDHPSAVLRTTDDAPLASCIGDDIVTASGLTLLGADDKAGVAEIMAAAEYLMAHQEIPHGPVRIAFTPDEEIGRGTAHFDVLRFGALCAYTLDGGGRGELEVENFSADAMTFTFQGFNTHPGYARGRMINAIKVAADFLNRLPPGEAPETTAGYEGFAHPYVIDAHVDRTSVKVLIRDFETDRLRDRERGLDALARATIADHPGATVRIDIEESYRNMREVLERHPDVADYARQAIERVGLAVRPKPIRGGTDGARLSFMGLPTPNLFAGEHNFHSRLEWVSAQEMEQAVAVIVELCRVWEERARYVRSNA
jgi:tripeptide aminopeptidase